MKIWWRQALGQGASNPNHSKPVVWRRGDEFSEQGEPMLLAQAGTDDRGAMVTGQAKAAPARPASALRP